MEEKLTQEELDERIAILRRFRSLLEQQRSKFQEYLEVLEKQETKIYADDADAIIAHSELENQIVAGISSLQKVIVPMQELYRKTNAASYNPAEAKPIEDIQQDLVRLQSQVLAQNQLNRDMLKEHIAQIKTQMNNLRNPYKTRSSIYADKGTVGTRILVEA